METAWFMRFCYANVCIFHWTDPVSKYTVHHESDNCILLFLEKISDKKMKIPDQIFSRLLLCWARIISNMDLQAKFREMKFPSHSIDNVVFSISELIAQTVCPLSIWGNFVTYIGALTVPIAAYVFPRHYQQRSRTEALSRWEVFLNFTCGTIQQVGVRRLPENSP